MSEEGAPQADRRRHRGEGRDSNEPKDMNPKAILARLEKWVDEQHGSFADLLDYMAKRMDINRWDAFFVFVLLYSMVLTTRTPFAYIAGHFMTTSFPLSCTTEVMFRRDKKTKAKWITYWVLHSIISLQSPGTEGFTGSYMLKVWFMVMLHLQPIDGIGYLLEKYVDPCKCIMEGKLDQKAMARAHPLILDAFQIDPEYLEVNVTEAQEKIRKCLIVNFLNQLVPGRRSAAQQEIRKLSRPETPKREIKPGSA